MDDKVWVNNDAKTDDQILKDRVNRDLVDDKNRVDNDWVDDDQVSKDLVFVIDPIVIQTKTGTQQGQENL